MLGDDLRLGQISRDVVFDCWRGSSSFRQRLARQPYHRHYAWLCSSTEDMPDRRGADASASLVFAKTRGFLRN
jgi:hypothetical protein